MKLYPADAKAIITEETAKVTIIPIIAATKSACELLLVGAFGDDELLSDAVTTMVSALEFIILISYLAEVLPGVVVEVLTVDLGVEVLSDVNVNVSAAVMLPFEFDMPIPKEEFSC